MMTILFLAVIFVGGCARLIHGGDKLIFSDWFKADSLRQALPACHAVGAIVAMIAFAAWQRVHEPTQGALSFSFIILAVGLGWFNTFVWRHQAYYSIGQSIAPRRPGIKWIDIILDKIFAVWPAVMPAAPYRIARDGLGFFLRQCYALPLFLLVDYLRDAPFYEIWKAPVQTLIFAFGSTVFYGIFNWFIAKPDRGDDELNESEIETGMLLMALLIGF